MSPRLLQGPWDFTESLRPDSGRCPALLAFPGERRAGQVSAQGWVGCPSPDRNLGHFRDFAKGDLHPYLLQDPSSSRTIAGMGSASRRCPTLRAARRRAASCWASRPVPMSRAPRVRVSTASSAGANDSSPFCTRPELKTNILPSFLLASFLFGAGAPAVEELTCLATWKDGNSRYLVGLVSHHHAISNEERYRCFVYEKISSLMGKKHPSQPPGKQDELLFGP